MKHSSSTNCSSWGRLGYLAGLACLSFGCHSFSIPGTAPASKAPETAASPKQHTLRVSQFVFLSDFPLDPNIAIFKELEGIGDRIYKDLQLPGSNALIQVYLFKDRERYEEYMKSRYPDLPKRRAFFVAQPRSVGGEDLLVFTYWGSRVQQDLRHELTHALLHSVLQDVPLWLDEGLAEYYEVPAVWRGVNYQHLDYFQDHAMRPNLARLEKLGQVHQMNPSDYRESWAWVHWMLEGSPPAREVLLAYLQQFRTNATPGTLQPLLAKAVPRSKDALQRHVNLLIEKHRPARAEGR